MKEITCQCMIFWGLMQSMHTFQVIINKPFYSFRNKNLFLIYQVCQCLMFGQVNSVKIYLKQLQQSIQTIAQPNLMPSDEGIVPKGVH